MWRTILTVAIVAALAFWSGLTIGERKAAPPAPRESTTNRYELHQVDGIAGMMVKFDKITGKSEIIPLFQRPAPSPWIDSQTAEK